MKAVRVGDPNDLASASAPADWPALSAADIAATRPDASWVGREGNQLVARCSAWWREAPQLDGERVGVIGHFATTSARATQVVLDAVLAEMSASGMTLAIGPMDGSTWRRYRFVTDLGHEPHFFLEPQNPREWPGWWTDCGWNVHTEYVSTVAEDLGQVDPGATAKARVLSRRGVRLRSIDLERYDEELRGIFAVASEAFARNYLYTPLDEASFRAQYSQMRSVIRPDLVTIAEADGECVGFFFAIPDLAEAQRGGAVRTAIAKTFAVRQGFAGLGGVLAQHVHETAGALGYERMVHALIHVGNDRSRSLSLRRAREIRRYALFERRLVER